MCALIVGHLSRHPPSQHWQPGIMKACQQLASFKNLTLPLENIPPMEPKAWHSPKDRHRASSETRCCHYSNPLFRNSSPCAMSPTENMTCSSQWWAMMVGFIDGGARLQENQLSSHRESWVSEAKSRTTRQLERAGIMNCPEPRYPQILAVFDRV